MQIHNWRKVFGTAHLNLMNRYVTFEETSVIKGG